MTSLAEEQEEQARWNARLLRPVPGYDKLVEFEFETAERQAARTCKGLAAMLDHAAQHVPHYRAQLAGPAGAIGDDPMRVLATLPILSKLDVQDAGAALRAEAMPSHDRPLNVRQSSGTTGRPTRVLHSMVSSRMFALLKQREYRWFRLDPAGKFSAMRMPNDLPRRTDGSLVPIGETSQRDTWPYMQNFSTGPFVGISLAMPVEERIAWLRQEQPDYLMTLAETLELVAMAAGSERPAESLKALVSISEQMTQGMRAYIEDRFRAQVHQNYGLNEIGLVACRCEAGRYHVHTEHCLVELVDNAGRPCPPGRSGRVIVTSLTNSAMPLLRYDTGDLAEAVGSACECGRTSPSFGEIVGRYARIAFLPEGTAAQANVLRDTIEKLPVGLARDLREFQIHQYRDGRMELRFVARAALPEAFFERMRLAWSNVAGGLPLEFVAVDEIARGPGGKSEVFTSDFFPPRDANR